MAKQKVSFRVLNDKNEELRTISVEVEPGKKLKKRAEDEAMKLIAKDEKIQMIAESAPDEDDAPKASPGGQPSFSFKFEFKKDGAEPRSETITVEAETHEYAWRKAVDVAQSKAKDGEVAQFVGDVVKQAVSNQ